MKIYRATVEMFAARTLVYLPEVITRFSDFARLLDRQRFAADESGRRFSCWEPHQCPLSACITARSVAAMVGRCFHTCFPARTGIHALAVFGFGLPTVAGLRCRHAVLILFGSPSSAAVCVVSTCRGSIITFTTTASSCRALRKNIHRKNEACESYDCFHDKSFVEQPSEGGHGIIPQSNILLATGAATLSMKAARI
jgi:hypothetical protein